MLDDTHIHDLAVTLLKVDQEFTRLRYAMMRPASPERDALIRTLLSVAQDHINLLHGYVTE